MIGSLKLGQRSNEGIQKSGLFPGDKIGGLAAVLQAQQPVPTAAATAARARGAFVAGWVLGRLLRTLNSPHKMPGHVSSAVSWRADAQESKRLARSLTASTCWCWHRDPSILGQGPHLASNHADSLCLRLPRC